MKNAIIVLVFICVSSVAANAQNKITIANNFFDAYEQMDFDKMGSYWDDSLKFQDLIVSELYGLEETQYGRETMLKLWKKVFSKKPNYMDISILDQFVSGDYVVTHLILESSISRGEKTAISNGEMFTIFKIENDKITEHYDFGDYYRWDRQMKSVMEGKHNVSYPEATNIMIARDYIKAYASGDVETMASFYADQIDFKDLTAKNVFKSQNYELQGKDKVKSFWKGVLVDSNPGFLNVEIDGSFYASNFVMLNTRFSMVLPKTWTGGKEGVYVNIPIKTVLQIKEGKIIKHFDFADYNVYNKQIALQK